MVHVKQQVPINTIYYTLHGYGSCLCILVHKEEDIEWQDEGITLAQ